MGRSEIHVKPKSSGVQQVAANISITPMPCVRDLAIYINGDLSMRSTDGFELLCRPPSTTLDSLVCACSHGPDAELCCLGALPPGLRQRCAGLVGIQEYLMCRLQSVQYAAARMILHL